MRSQEREPHFVPVFPVESYMDMSKEPFCMEIYRKNAGPQSKDTRFARACAVETHMDMSQEISPEPFCMEIYRKSAGPRFPDTHFDWKISRKNAHGHFRRAILCGNLQEKCRTLSLRTALRMEIYRKKRTWRCHKSQFVWTFPRNNAHYSAHLD